MMEITIRPATASDCDAVCALLTANQLPVVDIDKTLAHFFVATAETTIAGAIGLELYGQYGLLRSMVTQKAHRNTGVASKLVQVLTDYASSCNLTELYLLTETAKDYFIKKKFEIVERSSVPDELLESSEFSHVCPSSATVMKKILN
jgi:amino-acid N-acetyltransferase